MTTHRERVLQALRHEPVDRIPTQVNYTANMGELLAAHFGRRVEELPNLLDNHLVRVDLTHPTRLSQDGRIQYDWWGAGFDTGEEGYFIRHSPLAETRDLEAIPWPDPHEPGLFDGARQTVEQHGDEYFIIPNLGFALFERAWSLRGLGQFLTDMALDSAFVEALLDRITEIQLVLIHRYIELGVDGAYFGDDYGGQKSMLFSPQMWRRFIKPRLARLFAPFREKDLPVIMHSDGQIQPILPDLVELGLTTLNPAQPEVLDHDWLAETFGRQLSFYGGISTQSVLPYGKPDEVKRAVRECAHRLAPAGSGLLIGPSHRLMADVPVANVEAMLEAFSELGA